MKYIRMDEMGKRRSGFTLAEVVIASAIFVFVILGLIRLFLYCQELSAMSTNMALAISSGQDKLEEIRSSNFATVVTNYSSGGTPGNTFNLSQGTGKGVIYIDSSNADLLEINVVVCWQDNNGRIVGEDINLNGILDGGEDLNGNGRIDSPANLITKLAKK